MLVFTAIGQVPAEFGPSAVAIGKFDGVHTGHRAVIDRLLAVARAEQLVATAVTFDRHPLSLLRPELSPAPLVSNDQRLELLAQAGLDATLMLTFDRAFSEQPPGHFIDDVLVGALHARVVLVGSDFRFGARAAGTVETLREHGGFRVEVLDDVIQGARRASSTWVRELLAEGDVRTATRVLGHLPAVRSTVVHGEHRGRELGYPTANLAADGLEGFVPADGVYAAWLTVDGVRYGAAVSVGDNPTFDGVPAKQVEAYALDVEVDLYGRVAEVAFVERIRPMIAFDSVEALVERMHDDEARVRAELATSL